MQKEQQIILAVNPGLRYLGFAAFRGPVLIDWGLRIISVGTPRGRVRVANRFIAEAVERFHANTLVVKRLHLSRSSPSLDQLADSIRNLSDRRRLSFHQYSIRELKTELFHDPMGSKRKLAEQVALTYPILTAYFQKEMGNRHPYHLRMFEAVALGIVCYRQAEE